MDEPRPDDATDDAEDRGVVNHVLVEVFFDRGASDHPDGRGDSDEAQQSVPAERKAPAGNEIRVERDCDVGNWHLVVLVAATVWPRQLEFLVLRAVFCSGVGCEMSNRI